ncbi:MAG: type I-E CRISPR-associated protein Cse1/CasA, partial [Ardenticatenaceae bacterium]
MNQNPTFNLWSEPWMTAERADGSLSEVSIETLLCDAPSFRRLYDPSPLVVVAAQRLLIAILQDILRPESDYDLRDLWRRGAFPGDAIARFGNEFASRFD